MKETNKFGTFFVRFDEKEQVRFTADRIHLGDNGDLSFYMGKRCVASFHRKSWKAFWQE